MICPSPWDRRVDLVVGRGSFEEHIVLSLAALESSKTMIGTE
jgi:hypothetical protein